MDETTLTTRERIAYFLNNNQALLDLGLEENAVVQADTTESPTMRIFLVIRWLDTIQKLGPVSKRPFELWGYDCQGGDYTMIEKILGKAAELLTSETLVPLKTATGCISQIRDNETGYGRGSDLYDEGYNAVVIPWRFVAIATGL